MIPIKNFAIKLIPVVVLVLLAGNPANAQEKISPKLRLSYVKHMGGAYEIKAKAYVKNGGKIEPCMGMGIGFYMDADYDKQFKKLTTDHMGQATLLIDEQQVNGFKDSTGHFNFYAKLQGDSKYKSAEADLSVMSAAIDVNFKQVNDSTRLLTASLMCYDDAAKKMNPGVKLPLKCFVKRALCLLPFGKELNYTDEEGNAEVAFPNDIPGDKDGNLTVIIKLDEDDNYGTVQYEKTVKWGVPLLNTDNPLAHRSLVGPSNNAPWFMVIVISAILIGIWGYLCYIIYGLFMINKLGKASWRRG